jgi:hypothetical protein
MRSLDPKKSRFFLKTVTIAFSLGILLPVSLGIASSAGGMKLYTAVCSTTAQGLAIAQALPQI